MKQTPAAKIVRHVRAWPRRVLITVVTLVVLLVAARVAMPWVVRDQINKRLENIPGYTGGVEDIDLHIWRGAYSLHGVGIYRATGEVKEPFFLAEDIQFSVAWRELFRGKIVSTIDITRAQLTVVQGPTEETSQDDADRRWQDVIEDLFPIDIQRVELQRSTLHYVNSAQEPRVDLFVLNMYALATGLRNRQGEGGQEMPARITVAGDTLGGGKLALELQAAPLAEQPHFHLSVNLDAVNLPALNDMLRAYANVDVRAGTFRLAAEMAGKDGGFQGYVKPFFENMDFSDIEGQKKGIGSKIWETVVAAFSWIVKNKERDQVATRIPFEGRFGDAQVGVMATLRNLFRHGFIRAFNPTVEGSVDPENVSPTGESKTGPSPSEVRSDDPPVTPPTKSEKASAKSDKR